MKSFRITYARHWAFKTAAFILLIACVSAIFITAVSFLSEESYMYSAVNDNLAGRSFEQSDFLRRQMEWRINDALNYTAWSVYYGRAQPLEWSEGMYYHLMTPHGGLSNASPRNGFQGQPVWFTWSQRNGAGGNVTLSRNMEAYLRSDANICTGIHLAMTDELAARLLYEYDNTGRILWTLIIRLTSSGLMALILFVYLLVTCARQPHSDEKRLSPFWDKPWLDVLFGIVLALCAVFILVVDHLSSITGNEFTPRLIGLLTAMLAVCSAASVWWLLSAVKRLKTRTFLKHTLVFVTLAAVCRPLVRLIRSIYLWSPLKAQILFGKAAHFDAVSKALSRLAGGDYQAPIPEDGHGVLLDMARNVNAAAVGLRAAVEKELTGQRFKTELITNVSHDLRTPLTSVVTYADLLHSEGMDSPDSGKYLDIIRQKALRLQTLTEDLFEASKASSGETRAFLEPLDINQLIEQTIGEFADRLSAAGLEVRFTGVCGMAMADSKLLCRVFENLLRNAEKYSLSGTRVYIETANRSGSGTAAVTVRNISAAPLEGETGRLTERFARGDEARSSEGSGLGLAIAKSFMELQNGSFDISSDGDLFKVTLTLRLAA